MKRSRLGRVPCRLCGKSHKFEKHVVCPTRSRLQRKYDKVTKELLAMRFAGGFSEHQIRAKKAELRELRSKMK